MQGLPQDQLLNQWAAAQVWQQQAEDLRSANVLCCGRDRHTGWHLYSSSSSSSNNNNNHCFSPPQSESTCFLLMPNSSSSSSSSSNAISVKAMLLSGPVCTMAV